MALYSHMHAGQRHMDPHALLLVDHHVVCVGVFILHITLQLYRGRNGAERRGGNDLRGPGGGCGCKRMWGRLWVLAWLWVGWTGATTATSTPTSSGLFGSSDGWDHPQQCQLYTWDWLSRWLCGGGAVVAAGAMALTVGFVCIQNNLVPVWGVCKVVIMSMLYFIYLYILYR